jgi:hypothetical protein
VSTRPHNAADMGGPCCWLGSLSSVDVVVDQALVGHAGNLPALPTGAECVTGDDEHSATLWASYRALEQ